MPGMLKEDKITSIIVLLTVIIILIITIAINIYYKPFIGFYLVLFLLLFLESDLIIHIKGRKISENCYVMRYHRDHFIVTLNDRRAYIIGDRFGEDSQQIIYKETSPKWLPPHENELIAEQDYDYILNAVMKFLSKIKKEGVIKEIT
jgi:hypothetical protein